MILENGDIAGFCNAPVDEWEAYSEAISDFERQRRFPALDYAFSEIVKNQQVVSAENKQESHIMNSFILSSHTP